MHQSERHTQGAVPVKRSGVVVSLYVAAAAAAPMTAVEETRAVPGRGLEGDRYFSQVGTFSNKPGPSREVTLIEVEALEALKRDYQIELEPGDARRNIVTRGVPLNHLVGRDFQVGEVKLRGIRLCEPCSHLEQLTRPGIKRALVHRGGLRAQVLTSGLIRVGDSVRES
jgi:MOSC domain-containing protein YiiM